MVSFHSLRYNATCKWSKWNEKVLPLDQHWGLPAPSQCNRLVIFTTQLSNHLIQKWFWTASFHLLILFRMQTSTYDPKRLCKPRMNTPWNFPFFPWFLNRNDLVWLLPKHMRELIVTSCLVQSSGMEKQTEQWTTTNSMHLLVAN